MGNILKTRIVLRHDTTANWDAVKDTVVLLPGEAGLEYCEDGNIRIKFGDGTSTWSALEYWGGAHESLEEAIAQIEKELNNLGTTVADLASTIGAVEEGKTVIQMIEEAQAAATTNAINAILGEGVKEEFDTLREIADYIKQDQEGTIALTKKVAEIDQLTQRLDASVELKKYEIRNTPVGTLVDYNDKEIRVMCPKDTVFVDQPVGVTGDPNKYYISMRVYAPHSGIVSFKEDMNLVITDDTMHHFEGNDFAGIDAYGRKYSIVWLAVAYKEDGVWHYYGEKSSKSKYLGFNYSVEWYDEAGVRVGSDCIRISLSNEECHNVIEPYYIANVVKDHLGDIPTATMEALGLVKGSEEISVAEDGALHIEKVSTDKLVQGIEELVLDGGSATL